MDAALRAQLIEILERSTLFGVLPDAARVALLPHLEPCSLLGGETLFEQGQPADALYLLRSGSLGVFDPATADGERLLGTLMPGETVGEMSVLTAHSRTHRCARCAIAACCGCPARHSSTWPAVIPRPRWPPPATP